MEPMTMEPMLYVWDHAVFILERDIERARDAARKSMQHLPALLSLVENKCPVVHKCPVVQIAFQKRPAEPVAKMNGGEQVVACVPFRKYVDEADYADFTSVVLRNADTGTLRTMEVRGSVNLDNIPDGLVHSPT